VITTKANGGAEAILEGRTGTVLEERSSERELASAIAAALPLAHDTRLPYTIRDSVSEYDFSKKLLPYIALIER
jgi:hypothetical protein